MAKKSNKPPAEKDYRLKDAVLTGMTEALEKKKKHTAKLFGVNRQPRFIGIETPAIVFHYLLGLDVMPFSHMYYIAGRPQSRKSTLCFEFNRWLRKYDGFANLINTEGDKYSPSLHKQIMQLPRSDWNCNILRCTESLEQAQQSLTYSVETAEKVLRTADGGLIRPCGFFFDSLEGTADAGTHESVADEGFAEKNFSTSANINTRYFKTATAMFVNKPFFLAITNHIKERTNRNTGQPEVYTPGGTITKFLETFEIHMRKVKDIRTKTHRGVVINMTTEKNSFAEARRTIDVRLLYGQKVIDPDKPLDRSNVRKWAKWDWMHSLGSLLVGTSGYRGENKSDSPYSILRDYNLHFENVKSSDVENSGWSKSLDVPKTKPVSYAELGRKLAQRPDVLEKFFTALGVEQGIAFQTGEDYEKLVAKVEKTSYDSQLAAAAAKRTSLEGTST